MSGASEKVHIFERAGLGKAPFRYVGCTHRVGPIRTALSDGTVLEVGSPGQPMGTCDYCGQGIADCCEIKSSDGKLFIVGNVCVGKTYDKGLVNEVKREIGRARRLRRLEGEGIRILEAKAAFKANREVFEALPHSRGFKNRDTGVALTAADEVEWLLAHAGHTGKFKIAKKIEKCLKSLTV